MVVERSFLLLSFPLFCSGLGIIIRLEDFMSIVSGWEGGWAGGRVSLTDWKDSTSIIREPALLAFTFSQNIALLQQIGI
jgi:hypothetical protein